MKELKINVPDGYEIDKDKSTFEKIVFKMKREIPNSFYDLGEVEGCYVGRFQEVFEGTNCSDPDALIWKTKKQAKASIALAQLSQLRDVYRQGWVPDWNDGADKYCIEFVNDELSISLFFQSNCFLSFQDVETARLFLENFKDLIEQAKPLMS